MFGNYYGTNGFGGVSVPYKTVAGVTRTADVTTAINCNSPFAVQQMLKDLGYTVDVDGQIGNQTFAALKKFAAEHGASYAPGSFPKGDICSALTAAWQAKKGAAAPAPVKAPAPGLFVPSSGTQYAALKKAIAQGQAAAKAKAAQQAAAKAAAQAAALATQEAQAAAEGGIGDWWKNQSTAAKVAMGVGGLALVGGLIYFAVLRKPAAKMTPNKARGGKRAAKKRISSLKPLPSSQRPKTCRARRPKGYPTSRGQYALPECWMYPLDTKKHVRTAAARFGKHKRRYSKQARAKIAKRIDLAKRRFHIGQYR